MNPHENATRSAGNEVTPKSFRDAARALCTLPIRNSFFCDMRMSVAIVFYALISCHVTIREETFLIYEFFRSGERYLRKGVLLTEVNFDWPGCLDVFDSISLMMLTAG